MEKEEWKGAAIIEEGLTLLGRPGDRAPQETVVYLMHDRKNLYLGFDAREEEKDDFQPGHDGQPWTGDSVELALKITGTDSGRGYLHLIVDARGKNLYRGVTDAAVEGREVFKDRSEQIAAGKNPGGYSVEIALPLENIGITESPEGRRVGFNIMRNRYFDGKAQALTLVPGNTYFDLERFHLVLQ